MRKISENKELGASAADAADRVTDERSHEGASPPSGSVPTGAWVSVIDALPPEHGPPILITNNFKARNAFGHMSHVWVADMLHDDPDEPGSCTAFVGDNLRKIWGVTHWRAITPGNDVGDFGVACGADLDPGEAAMCGPLAWLTTAVDTLSKPEVMEAVMKAEGSDDPDAYWEMVSELRSLFAGLSAALSKARGDA